jgi:hypothetical protein
VPGPGDRQGRSQRPARARLGAARRLGGPSQPSVDRDVVEAHEGDRCGRSPRR